MSTFQEVLFGTALLVLCSIIHVATIIGCVRLVQAVGQRFPPREKMFNFAVTIGTAFGAIVVIHTIQIWIWAVVFLIIGALETMPQALYFSVVTYTTLGYGDITLDDGYRLFGTFEAMTGLVTFGLSTAFLVGLMTKVLPDQ